jgi:hypothetical protein
LGFHFFLEALLEWLRVCPKAGPFPQISQAFGIVSLYQQILNTIYSIFFRKNQPAFSRNRTAIRPFGYKIIFFAVF